MFRSKQLWRVILAALVTASILIGLGAWSRSRTSDGLLSAALTAHPQVEAVTIHKDNGQLEVQVALGAVDNLREAYLNINDAAARAVADTPVVLTIEDRRNDELLDDYYALHYFVAEALTRGTFPTAAARLQAAGEERGLDHVGFFVDSQRVYLQLHRGEAYLYEIVQREPGWPDGGQEDQL